MFIGNPTPRKRTSGGGKWMSFGFMSFSPEMGVSKYRGTPRSSILIGFSIINHPFWGFSPYFWFNTQISGFSPPQIFLAKKVTYLRCSHEQQPDAEGSGCWARLVRYFSPAWLWEIHLRSLTASFPLKNGGKGRLSPFLLGETVTFQG